MIISLRPKGSMKGSQTPTFTLKKLMEAFRSVQMHCCFWFRSHRTVKLEKFKASTGKKLLSLSLMRMNLRP